MEEEAIGDQLNIGADGGPKREGMMPELGRQRRDV